MRYTRHTGPPTWFVVLIAVALVFGLYYLWVGFLGFMERGGVAPDAATQQSIAASTATRAQVLLLRTPTRTPRPSSTPAPNCQRFVVTVELANVRAQADTRAELIAQWPQGTEICVFARLAASEWYSVDADPFTRRVEEGYMRFDVIDPLEPSPTPMQFTPPPTITLTPSLTPSPSPT